MVERIITDASDICTNFNLNWFFYPHPFIFIKQTLVNHGLIIDFTAPIIFLSRSIYESPPPALRTGM